MSTPITLVPIGRPARPARAAVALTIDGRPATVPEGTTILGAAATLGITIPTLCYLETLRPVNVCRLCVVEVEGARVLVPSCARAVEAGMVVHTRSPRVRQARKMVLELLASSVDLSTAPGMAELLAEYGCAPERYGPPAPPEHRVDRDHAVPGHHAPPDVDYAATVAQPPKIDNELYVRDYGKCVLCYKCVEACGIRSPAHVRHRGGRAWIRRPHLDGVRRRVAGLSVRVLRQLHRRLPDRRADGEPRVRPSRPRRLGRHPRRRRRTPFVRTAVSAAP